MKKVLSWCKSHPKLISALLSAIGAIVLAVLTCSCGVTRASVRNGATGTSTEIKITTNNPTTVTADPNVTLNSKN